MSFNDSLSDDTLQIVTEEAYNPIHDDEDVFADSFDTAPTDDFADGGSINTNYSLAESGEREASRKRPSSRVTIGGGFQSLRSASLSVSMLEKPSDDRKANSFLAGWNVSNLIQGTGILGVPYAVQQGGWAAVAMILLVALLCCYTGKLLIECMYEKSKKTGIRRRLRVNYPEVAEAVMGRKGHVILGIIQSVEMFGGVIMYVVLLGTVWADLFQKVTGLGFKEWAAIMSCLSLPTLFITKMSIVSWLSMLSVFSLMSSIITLIAFCCTQVSVWFLANIPPFNPQTFPVGFGIIVFSYTAHAVFPSIEGSMKKPKQFNSMMNYSFLLAAVVKGILGMFMVLTFGETTEEVATVNLAAHPVWSRLATALVIGNVLLAVPLNMFVVSLTFDDAFLTYFPHLNRDSKYHWVWLLITRPLLMTLALFLGIMVPHFGLLMGVIGSFTGTSLCFVFPCYFHLKLRWSSLAKWEVAIDILVMIFGFIAGGLGLAFSAKALIMTYL